MSSSTKKGIPQTLILKSFLPYPTLSADSTLPLAAFDMDFFSILIKEESEHSNQTTKKWFVKDHYQKLLIENKMAEIDDHSTSLLPGIHSNGKSYSNQRNIAAFNNDIAPTMSSSSRKAHFEATSRKQKNTSQSVPSHKLIASCDDANKIQSFSLPAKRKLHLDDQANVQTDNTADDYKEQEIVIQTKRNRTNLPSNPHDIATISDNTKSSSFVTEESSSLNDTHCGEKTDSSRSFYNDTLQTLKSLDSVSPPLPTDDAEHLHPSKTSSLPLSHAEGQVTASNPIEKYHSDSSGNVSKLGTVKRNDTENLSRYLSSEEVDTAESNQRSLTRHADHPFRDRNEELGNCLHEHTRRAIDDEREDLTLVQQDSLPFDDLEDTKASKHHELVDSWQAYMDQQNFKDGKGYVISDQSNHLTQSHPSWKYNTTSDGYTKNHSFPSSYSGPTTHPYKHHAATDYYPTMPYYQHHPASGRKHSNHATGQNVHLLSMTSSRNESRPQESNEWRRSDLSVEQVVKKREYLNHHREREHQIYPYHQEYDYQQHNSMYEYHDDLQPTCNFGGFEENALPPVPPLSDAQYLGERGDDLVHSHDVYANPTSTGTNVFDHHEPYDYHSSTSNRRVQPPAGIYGSYSEHARGYARQHHPGYPIERRQHVNSYHGGRHRVFNSTTSSGYKNRSMDSASTSSLSSSFFYSQQASGGNGLQPYYNRQILALSTEDDENWLSEFLCFVRSQCVEVFSATREDVASRMNSKKVLLGQVGIRCRFCAHLPHRERTGRSSSFPSSISRIYQSLTMMLRDHFTKCHAMPPAIQERYLSLKANASQGATDSKKYWMESANSLGLIDTTDGIRFRNQCHPVYGAESSLAILEEEQESAEVENVEAPLSSV